MELLQTSTDRKTSNNCLNRRTNANKTLSLDFNFLFIKVSKGGLRSIVILHSIIFTTRLVKKINCAKTGKSGNNWNRLMNRLKLHINL